MNLDFLIITHFPDLKNGVYKPDCLPRAPLVLCPIKKHHDTTKIITKHFAASGNRNDNNSANVSFLTICH